MFSEGFHTQVAKILQIRVFESYMSKLQETPPKSIYVNYSSFQK